MLISGTIMGCPIFVTNSDNSESELDKPGIGKRRNGSREENNKEPVRYILLNV